MQRFGGFCGQDLRNQAHVTTMPQTSGTKFPLGSKPWYSGIRHAGRVSRCLYKGASWTITNKPGVAHC
jgi:hypothetical protein